MDNFEMIIKARTGILVTEDNITRVIEGALSGIYGDGRQLF